MKLENLFDENIIKIDQYILTHLNSADVSSIYEIYKDPRCTEFQALKSMHDISDASHYLDNTRLHISKRYFMKWAIREISSHELIGLFSVHHLDLINHTCQFGYILNPRYWHMGIMSKVLSHMTSALLDEHAFHRIELNIHPDNSASIHVATRCGYEREGLKKQCAFNPTSHTYEDRYLYSKLR